MTESTSNTLMAPNFITDAVGGVWGVCPSLTKGEQVCHNGVVDTTTSNVALLLYFNHIVYFENTSGTFYSYTSAAWKQTVDPRLPTETPSGTTVSVVGTLIYASNTSGAVPPANSKLDTWSFNASGQVVHNGVVDTITGNVAALVYVNHTVWQSTPADGSPWLWWYWTSQVAGVGGSWTLATTTPFPTVPTIPTPTVPKPTPTVPTPVPTSISTIHFGNSPPASLPNTTGGVSPLGWNVTFFDDFTSLNVNTSAWTCTTGAVYPFGGSALATYNMTEGGASNNQAAVNPNNLSQSGSVLSLNATNVAYGGLPFSTCGIFSDQFLNERWGYWECNTKMPLGANGSQNGLWGSFWVSCTNGSNWPQEVDMQEQNISNGNGVAMNSTLHYSAGVAGGTFEGMAIPNGGSSITGFHTYGGLVTPNYIAFYCDGHLMGTAYNGQNGFTGLNGVVGSGASATNPNKFYFGYDVMCFIISLAIGSADSGTSATAASFPCAQQVDWVRFSALGPQ